MDKETYTQGRAWTLVNTQLFTAVTIIAIFLFLSYLGYIFYLNNLNIYFLEKQAQCVVITLQ